MLSVYQADFSFFRLEFCTVGAYFIIIHQQAGQWCYHCSMLVGGSAPNPLGASRCDAAVENEIIRNKKCPCTDY